MAEQPDTPASEGALQAVAALQRYGQELHRYLTRRMGQPSTVDDLMQQIYERFSQVPGHQHIRNVQAYLYTVASHLVREYLDREGRSPVTYDSEAVDAAAQRIEHSVKDDMLEQLALQQELTRALLKLPPVHRAVFLLVKRDGLSYEEVAQKFTLELSTVTRYVFEARSRMKMLLKRDIGDEGRAP